MSKKKIVYILCLLIIFNLILGGMVYASSDLDVKLTSNIETVKPEDEIIIKLKIEKANISDSNGVKVFLGTLNYDKEIFEEVQDTNIKLLNDWSGLAFNKDKGILLMTKVNSVEMGEELLEINLKVKNNISFEKTQIGINEISYANSEEEITGEGSSITIKMDNNKKMIITIIVISVAVVGLLFGIVMGRMIVKKKKGEGYNDFEE